MDINNPSQKPGDNNSVDKDDIVNGPDSSDEVIEKPSEDNSSSGNNISNEYKEVIKSSIKNKFNNIKVNENISVKDLLPIVKNIISSTLDKDVAVDINDFNNQNGKITFTVLVDGVEYLYMYYDFNSYKIPFAGGVNTLLIGSIITALSGISLYFKRHKD